MSDQQRAPNTRESELLAAWCQAIKFSLFFFFKSQAVPSHHRLVWAGEGKGKKGFGGGQEEQAWGSRLFYFKGRKGGCW